MIKAIRTFDKYYLRKSMSKGSMMVEAAIVLPIFIVAAAMLGCLVKTLWLNVFLVEACTDQMRLHCIMSPMEKEYLHKPSIVQIDAFLLEKTIDRTLQKSGLKKGDLNIRAMPVRENGASGSAGDTKFSNVKKGIVNINLEYDVKMNFPRKFVDALGLKKSIEAREWVGLEYDAEPFLFSDMEIDADSNMVAIFPNSGECYHDMSCKILVADKESVVLSKLIRRKYKSCPLCCEGNETDGQTVYVFKYGGCYHEEDCHSVEKYFITMDLRDAKIRNYRVCNICGG